MNKKIIISKIFYALIAIPLFIFGPLGLFVCTDCPYSDSLNPFIPFLIASIIYYIIVILPLNYLQNKYVKNLNN